MQKTTTNRKPYWTAILDSLTGQPYWTDLLDNLIGQPYWTTLLDKLIGQDWQDTHRRTLKTTCFFALVQCPFCCSEYCQLTASYAKSIKLTQMVHVHQSYTSQVL